jgi:hypothetical protein
VRQGAVERFAAARTLVELGRHQRRDDEIGERPRAALGLPESLLLRDGAADPADREPHDDQHEHTQPEDHRDLASGDLEGAPFPAVGAHREPFPESSAVATPDRRESRSHAMDPLIPRLLRQSRLRVSPTSWSAHSSHGMKDDGPLSRGMPRTDVRGRVRRRLHP